MTMSPIFLAVSMSAAISGGETADVRERVFVSPARIVWSEKVEQSERLLTPKFGQVCEGGFGKAVGTVLNAGGAIILDFGRELHGGLNLAISPGDMNGVVKLRLRFGESVAETMSEAGGGKGATNDHAIRDTVLQVPKFGEIEIGNTGFRFVRLELAEGENVGLESVRAVSLMRPMKPIGGFRSSDDRLNRIFDTSVRTVHLCCQNYLWDGIKRDRLVWMGDMHPETTVILNVFGADDILPRSLDYIAAVTPPGEWANTMATYTLWWVRNLAEWVRYTNDIEYLKRHGDYLAKVFDHIVSGMSDEGWIAGSFLDWPTSRNHAAESAGTQALALMTARDTVFLAKALGNEQLSEKAAAMSARLEKLVPDPNGAKSAAALLALSGLRSPADMYASVLSKDGCRGVSTFYGYYVLEALSAAGHSQAALDIVRDYWGAMLEVGATSFWEDFNVDWTNGCFRIDEMPIAGRSDIHGDNGAFCYRGFRHSLCHGWSAGPASWCINRILGIRPITVGCRKVEVKPFLGDLAWAEGAMALPNGEKIEVRAVKGENGEPEVEISAPDWVEIVR